MSVGLFLLEPELVRAGWPYNHDGLRPLLRIAEAWGQWHAGHWLPIWSNASQFGAGSPGVLLYHKLFGYTGAAIRFAAPGPKRELCLTLLAFMIVNFLGTGLAIRVAAGRPHLLIELLCGFVAVSCNYAFTDWLTRGAVSEFSAYCVLPWVFAWCFAWLKSGRPSVWIGPLMWLLWLAHSAIAAYAWVLLAPCVALAATRQGWEIRRAVMPIAGTVGIFILLSLPFALAAVPMIDWAQVSNMIQTWRPSTTHVPFIRIFADTQWTWGDRWYGFTPQLDPILLATGIALPLTIVLSRAQRWSASLCLVTASLALALQLKVAIPLYSLIPGLEYIAFTWRLLTYASMALVIGLGVVLLAVEPLLHARRRWALPAAALCVLAIAAIGKPRRPGPDQPWFTPHDLALGQLGVPSNLMSVEYPEYLPRTPSGPGHPKDHWQAALEAGLCQQQPMQDQMVEAARQHFRNVCPVGNETVLPAFLAPGMRVSAGGVTLPIHRTCDDPRVRFTSPPVDVVTLRMPTIGRALHDWWVRGPAYGNCENDARSDRDEHGVG